MFPEGRALEFLIAAIVALIVVGPKDLPILLRKFGQFMAKVRSMAAEFRASFDEMARQSELDELRKEVEAMRKGQLLDMETHAPEVNQAFDEISQGLSDVGVQLNAPVAYPYAAETTIEVKPPTKAKASKAKASKSTASKPKALKAPAKKAPTKKTPAPKAAAKSAVTPKVAKPKSKAAAPKSSPAEPAPPRRARKTASARS